MAKAEYWQRGEAIDYLNETDEVIEYNQIIVFGSHVGIAGAPIQPGEVGALLVEGVYEMPKAEGEEIEAGADVSFDGETVSAAGGSSDGGNTGDEGGTSSSSSVIGYAVQAAAADDETVKVKILG